MKKLEEIKEIYLQSFERDIDFENHLFSLCPDCIKTFKHKGRTVSFLFALPCEIKGQGYSEKAVYIFAAATHKEFRNNGFMGRLLEELKLQINLPLILRPADNHLVSYYEKFGFKKFIAQDTNENALCLLAENNFKVLTEITPKTSDGEFVAMVFNCNADLNGLYFPYSMP